MTHGQQLQEQWARHIGWVQLDWFDGQLCGYPPPREGYSIYLPVPNWHTSLDAVMPLVRELSLNDQRACTLHFLGAVGIQRTLKDQDINRVPDYELYKIAEQEALHWLEALCRVKGVE